VLDIAADAVEAGLQVVLDDLAQAIAEDQ